MPQLQDTGGLRFLIKISDAFQNKKAFIGFVTGGDPDIETTEKLIPAMEKAGADLIEIGIPFSDPIAEGIVIQEADIRALSSGTTTDKLFDMVERIRPQVSIPLVFMTYMNPVYTYGTRRFMEKCAQVGINGVIIPDVPFEEWDEVKEFCEAAGVELISMIAPTSHERIHMIASKAKGFLCCVSSLGVTGVRNKITTNIAEMVQQVKEVSDFPCAIGFGISTPQQAAEMAAVSDGVIVGSAIVKIIAQYGRDCIGPVCEYVEKMKRAIR